MIPPHINPGRWLAPGLIVLVVAGCTKAPSSLAEVSGTVTLDGKPLSGVTVTFYPVAEKSDAQAAHSIGTTDASGAYTLSTADGRKGAVVGKHKVVVNWPMQERGQPPKTPEIPMAYTQLLQTPIEKDVVAGPNNIVIEVKR